MTRLLGAQRDFVAGKAIDAGIAEWGGAKHLDVRTGGEPQIKQTPMNRRIEIRVDSFNSRFGTRSDAIERCVHIGATVRASEEKAMRLSAGKYGDHMTKASLSMVHDRGSRNLHVTDSTSEYFGQNPAETLLFELGSLEAEPTPVEQCTDERPRRIENHVEHRVEIAA